MKIIEVDNPFSGSTQLYQTLIKNLRDDHKDNNHEMEPTLPNSRFPHQNIYFDKKIGDL